MKVRTRIGPSPTGDPHMGTAYVGLINMLFARQHGGDFILRIEDTDQLRSNRESEAMLFRSLRWLGLEWSEGPDVGGPHGPYRQSERSAIYAEYAAKLLETGGAFRCICTPERLDALREDQRRRGERPRYDGHCRHLSDAELARADQPSVIRLVVPHEGVCTIDDYRRGPIAIEWQTVDMQVLVKSDGLPTYHLANVVDDHLMGITHVMRGEEWISSAPKHQLLYQYFGWQMPVLCHLPLLRNPDKSKLSKRKNPTSILFYERMGYLPEALLNFLGLLAISSPDGEEMMDVAAMVEKFDLAALSLNGPIFDVTKLNWLNGRYLREALSVEQLAQRLVDWAFNADYAKPVIQMAQTRMERLSDLAPLALPLFSGKLGLGEADVREAKLELDDQRKLYQLTIWALDDVRPWTAANIDAALRAIAEQLTLKFRDVVRAYYRAINGAATGLPIFESMFLLGRDISRERLRDALAALGAPSAKEAEAWRKSGAEDSPE